MEALAKEEYTNILVDLLFPHMYKGFQRMWSASKRDSKEFGDTVTHHYEKRLECVKDWNQSVIDAEYNSITGGDPGKIDWLKKVIDAVFVSNTKVLASIRIKAQLNTIPLCIPDAKVFVHQCYLNAARTLWSYKSVFEDRRGRLTPEKQQKNFERAFEIIKDAIHAAIRQLLPLREILNETLKEEEEPKPPTVAATVPPLDDGRPSKEDDDDSDTDTDDEKEETKEEVEEKVVKELNEDTGAGVGGGESDNESEADDVPTAKDLQSEPEEEEEESQFMVEPKGHLDDILVGNKIEDMTPSLPSKKETQEDEADEGPKFVVDGDDPFFDD